MRSMRSMRGGFIFRNRGPSLEVHHGQHLASMSLTLVTSRIVVSLITVTVTVTVTVTITAMVTEYLHGCGIDAFYAPVLCMGIYFS